MNKLILKQDGWFIDFEFKLMLINIHLSVCDLCRKAGTPDRTPPRQDEDEVTVLETSSDREDSLILKTSQSNSAVTPTKGQIIELAIIVFKQGGN